MLPVVKNNIFILKKYGIISYTMAGNYILFSVIFINYFNESELKSQVKLFFSVRLLKLEVLELTSNVIRNNYSILCSMGWCSL